MTRKKRRPPIVGKPITIGKYGGNQPTIFRTRPDGSRYPMRGEVLPPVRNVDIDTAMSRINERFKQTQAFAARVSDATTLSELEAIQREVIESDILDQYDKDILINTVIDRKFSELLAGVGRTSLPFARRMTQREPEENE